MVSSLFIAGFSNLHLLGMYDVLPKPFTKEGMLRSLEKHLSHFKKNATFTTGPSQQMQAPAGFVNTGAGQTPLGLNMGQLSAPPSIKDETSPGKSPATVASSWHSPSQMPGQSPIGNPHSAGPFGMQSQPQMGEMSRQYTMTPTHPHAPHPNSHMSHPHPQSAYPSPSPGPALGGPARGHGGPHRRVMSDMTGGPGPGPGSVGGGHDEHADKRQRMFPPPSGGFQQG